MAVSPIDVDPVAYRVAQIYAQAEERIVRRMVEVLNIGPEKDSWEREQLAALQRLREEALAVLGDSAEVAALRQQVLASYDFGAGSALLDMGEYIDANDAILSGASRGSISRLAAETAGVVATANTAVLRNVDDLFRRVVADVAGQTLLGNITRREAIGSAVNRILGTGISSFRDTNGRMWNIPDYVQMATRTATARASIQGHTETANSYGFDLVIVNPGPRPCKTCDRWAGKILWSGSGRSGEVTRENMVTGRPMRVRVDGTLTEARAAGWGHPNCRCNIKVYIPGATKVDSRPPWDQDGYEAQQRQRQIEKKIRDWKIQATTAKTPEAATRARARVAQWQAAQRAHMTDNPFLKRQYAREQTRGLFGPDPRTTLARPRVQEFVDVNSAESLAAEAYRRAYEVEPSITASMRQVASRSGVEFTGYTYRLKTEGSIARKIASDAQDLGVSLEQASLGMSDTVRYTFLTSERAYTRTMDAVLDDLVEQGYQVRVKNYWVKDNNPYQGVNVALTSPSGFPVELQFHTEVSIDVKEGIMHKLYEESRKLPADDPRVAANNALSFEAAKRIPVPPGVLDWSYGS